MEYNHESKLMSFKRDHFITHHCVVRACLVVTVKLSGISKAKQKLGRTFNSDKLGSIAFTKISKLTMCSA